MLKVLVKLTDLVVKFCFLSFPSAFRFVLLCHMSSLAKLISFTALHRDTKLKLTCPGCRFVTSQFGYNKARAEHKVRQGLSEHISEIAGHDSILLATQIKSLDFSSYFQNMTTTIPGRKVSVLLLRFYDTDTATFRLGGVEGDIALGKTTASNLSC